jgi:phage gpG-like protein
MANAKNLFNRILSDLKVELTDEFDRNFERKGFFDEPWPDTAAPVERGSLMMRTGDLRGGMRADIESGYSIRFTNSMPYAVIHNEGGEIVQTPTAEQRAWAWAQYKETQNAMYKAMALTKGDWTIKIPKRQFLGEHEEVDRIVDSVITDAMHEHFEEEFGGLIGVR